MFCAGGVREEGKSEKHDVLLSFNVVKLSCCT